MKTFTLLLVMIFIGGRMWGQNLVPNPSFEEHDTCPDFVSQVRYAIPWFQPTLGTPDYYNSCADSSSGSWAIDVPHNLFGFQFARTGNAYTGLYAWYPFVQSSLGLYREYIEVKLNSPLVHGTIYYVSFSVSLCDSSEFATDDIQAAFSNDTLQDDTFFLYNVVPQIVNQTGFLVDRNNWIKIEGSFTASGGEQFLTIGNFKGNTNSDTLFVPGGGNNFSFMSYYYIDDVCVSSDASSCLVTGIETINKQSSFFLSPNPVQNLLTIHLQTPPATVEVYDAAGRKMILQKITGKQTQLDVTTLLPGMYLLQLTNIKTGERGVEKFVKE